MRYVQMKGFIVSVCIMCYNAIMSLLFCTLAFEYQASPVVVAPS